MKASPSGSKPSRGDDGTVFVQQGGGRDKEKDPPAPCRVAVASENYGRIVRVLEKKIPVTMYARHPEQVP